MDNFKERALIAIGEAMAQMRPGPESDRACRMLFEALPELRERVKDHIEFDKVEGWRWKQ